jgi:hypothetical protein
LLTKYKSEGYIFKTLDDLTGASSERNVQWIMNDENWTMNR